MSVEQVVPQNVCPRECASRIRVLKNNLGANVRSMKPPKIESHEIHTNPAEAFNSSLRRRNSAFRRRTNTDSKTRENLQRTLDVQWLIQNFVRVHFTTKVIPADRLGVMEVGLTWMNLFSIRYAL